MSPDRRAAHGDTRGKQCCLFTWGSTGLRGVGVFASRGLTEGEKLARKETLCWTRRHRVTSRSFKPGDLIRNILGADPNSGAVAIGGFPRVGQTLQYQLRTRTRRMWSGVGAPLCRRRIGPGPAGLAPLCLHSGEDPAYLEPGVRRRLAGRNSRSYAAPGAAEYLEEIGPLGGRNYIHSYIATSALFFDEETEAAG
jgi:hypothetical protein